MRGVYDADNDKLKLDVDEAFVSEITTTGNPPTQGNKALGIGGVSAVPSQFFDGTIHEVRMRDDARTPAEIADPTPDVDEPTEPNLQLKVNFPNGVPQNESKAALTTNVFGTLDPETVKVLDNAGEAVPGIAVDFNGTGDVNVDLTVPAGLTLTGGPNTGVTITGNGKGTSELLVPEAAMNTVLASLQAVPEAGFYGPPELTISAAQTGSATLTDTIPL